MNVCRVNVIEGEPNDRQMTTGNHTVRDIYCCKCKTILGWKYVSVPFAFIFPSIPVLLTDPPFLGVFLKTGQSVRTVPEVQRREVHPRAQPPRRRTIIGGGRPVTFSGAPERQRSILYGTGTPSAFFGKHHIFDLLGIAFFLTCDGTLTAPHSHKQHSSNLAFASLHPHVDIGFSPSLSTPTHTIHPSPFNHYPPPSTPIIAPCHHCPTGKFPTLLCPSVARPFIFDGPGGCSPLLQIPRNPQCQCRAADASELHQGTFQPVAARRFPYQVFV